MEFLAQSIDFILRTDTHLPEIVSTYRYWTYGILFLIILCETGLVVAQKVPLLIRPVRDFQLTRVG